MRCVRSPLIHPTWKRSSMQPVSSMSTTLAKSWIGMRQLLESELSSHRCKSLECSNGNAGPRNHPLRKSSARRCSTKPRETRSGQELWHESTVMECLHLSTLGTKVGDQQNFVQGSHTSTRVTRRVRCVLPCLARQRRVGEASDRSQIERRLALVCGESAPWIERVEQGVPRGVA